MSHIEKDTNTDSAYDYISNAKKEIDASILTITSTFSNTAEQHNAESGKYDTKDPVDQVLYFNIKNESEKYV